jgi:hypothetical protein
MGKVQTVGACQIKYTRSQQSNTSSRFLLFNTAFKNWYQILCHSNTTKTTSLLLQDMTGSE